MVASLEHDLPTVAVEVEEGAHDEPLGIRCGGGGVEDVAGDEDEVDILLVRRPDDICEHGIVLVEAGSTLEDLAYVPVGSVKDAHVDSREVR